MGSVAHMADLKKELVKIVHRLAQLGARIEEFSKGCFMVRHNSESSLVVDVKSKQHLYPLVMELKEPVLKTNNKSSPQEEDGVLRYQLRLCVTDIDGLREKIMVTYMIFICEME